MDSNQPPIEGAQFPDQNFATQVVSQFQTLNLRLDNLFQRQIENNGREQIRLHPVPHFSGEPKLGAGFIAQCEVAFRLQPAKFPSSAARVGYVVSALKGKALDWFIGVTTESPQLLDDYCRFRELFLDVFGRARGLTDSVIELSHFKQGNLSVEEYAIDFHVLASRCNLPEHAKLGFFYNGLRPKIQELLENQHPSSLVEMVDLATRVERRHALNVGYQHRTADRGDSDRHPKMEKLSTEPMEVDRVWRPRPAPRVHCLMCGKMGHWTKNCSVTLNSKTH